MKKYKICSRCVMDSEIQDIIFDDNGICNYCKRAEARILKEYYIDNNKFLKLIEEIKNSGKNKKYDCLIGMSGGVDSSYIAYLVKKHGLRPLAIHFDNGWNSELAVVNIENILNKLNIDFYTHVVNWEEFKDLQLSFLKSSISNCEIPTDHGIVAILYKLASKYNIKFILHGGNLATESIMPEIWMHDSKDLILLEDIHSKFGTKKLKTFPRLGYIKLFYYTIVEKIRYVGLLNYINYNKDEAINILENEFSWRKYGGKHFESIYTKFFQSYILPRKFNIDKRKAHLSSLIITNQITRQKAMLELSSMPYNADEIDQSIEYVCQKLNITKNMFDEIMIAPIKTASDYKNSKRYLIMFDFIVKKLKLIATSRN